MNQIWTEKERKAWANDSTKSLEGTRESKAKWARRESAKVADIGRLPAVVNQERKDKSKTDLLFFLSTYFPLSTGRKPFGADQIRGIKRTQDCVLSGGWYYSIYPRGYAKTTTAENSAIWAALHGHRKFIPIFSADAKTAEQIIDSIKIELSENDLLYEDFPEACHAIRALEGKSQRCKSQTYRWTCDGCQGRLTEKTCPACLGTGLVARQTHIEWKSGWIVLPTMPNAPSSGAILTAHGITAASRGMKHKTPDGTQLRPDLVIIDDPQTDESAASPLQVEKRLDVIRKSILKLGGHNRRISCVLNGTIIEQDDLMAQIADHKKFPAWQGERVKMVREWPDLHDTLWQGDYARIRQSFDPKILGDQQRAHRAATEFYARNQAAMDEGGVVSWDHCYGYDDANEISAIQHAENCLIDDGPRVFASECQNDPLLPRIEGQQDTISAEQIRMKLNRLSRGKLPLEASRLVAFIDVHDSVLYWTVAGFGDGFTGAVVDYGTWPDQKRSYFALSECRRTIEKETKKETLEAQLYAALDALVNDLMSREWPREDGALFKPERIPIDARDRDHAETVKLFCRRSPHAAVLIPSTGIYVGAKGSGLNERAPVAGERRGWNWKIAPIPGSRGILRFDTNAWKTRLHSLWSAPMGASGCLSLFGESPETHRMFSEHQVAEFPTLVSANGRSVREWQNKPGRDNHFFDTLVGCSVAAGTLGVDVVGVAVPRKVVKLSDLQRTRRVWSTERR